MPSESSPPPPAPPPLRHQLTLGAALKEDENRAIVVLELLRRWLELRPELTITLQSHRGAEGQLQAAVSIGWSYLHAPPQMAGTWAAVADVDEAPWPLHAALHRAARLFEAAERKGSAT
jgi:hypothetical protein